MKQSEPKPTDSWAFFDKVYCISLDERSDRREQAREQFASLGLLDRVEFVIVTKHPENQEEGIFESHMMCLNKGLEADANHILIFEDDIFFQNFNKQALFKVCNHLAFTTTWSALFLGCITDGSSNTKSNNLVKIKYRCLSHAYALNRTFAQKLVQETWNGLPYDMLLKRYNEGFYAIYPMCAFQGKSSSDNQTVAIDRVRRLFGGLPFIQKVNELYQNHKAVLLLSNLAMVIVFALLVCKLW